MHPSLASSTNYYPLISIVAIAILAVICEGIDVSTKKKYIYCCSMWGYNASVVEEARKKGYETYTGSAEDVIQQIADKSVEHVIAMPSLYYIKDFEELVMEFERVAWQTLFISIEQFNLENIEILKVKEIHLYNHPASLITNPTEVVANVFLWKRPSNDDKIYWDIVFKKLVI